MKKIVLVFGLFLLIAGIAAAQASKGGTMYVATKTLAVKSGTGFFAGTKGTLNYGDKVSVLQVSGKYVEVRSAANSSLSGWVATANLSAKQIASGNTASASAREVALAGKGFNQEVENSYKSSQKNLNYADVDKVETITVSESDLRQFLTEGRLSMGE
jgi:uncharacterized protein YgiM (DUF1202 family)